MKASKSINLLNLASHINALRDVLIGISVKDIEKLNSKQIKNSKSYECILKVYP